MRSIALVVAVVALFTAGVAAQTGPERHERQWVFHAIGDSARWVPVAVNDRGQIAGRGWTSRSPYWRRAVYWERGRLTNLGTLGGKISEVGPSGLLPTSATPSSSPINERGEVVGWSQTSDSAVHGFFWRKGRMRDLGTLGGRRSAANAINDGGQIVGSAQVASGAWHAFLWENGRMRDLGTLGGMNSWASAINARGQVVGVAEKRIKSSDGEAIAHAFLWEHGRMRDLGTLGGKESQAFAINDRGQVVGTADTRARYPRSQLDPEGSQVSHAFIWQRGTIRDLGVLPGVDSTAFLINAQGRVAGCAIDYGSAEGEEQMFTWQAGRIDAVGTKEDVCDLRLTGLSLNGRLVGSRNWTDRSRGFVWENGQMIDLIDPAHTSLGSEATGINHRGTIIVGWADEKTAFWTLKPRPK